MAKKKEEKTLGRFTLEEDQYIKANHIHMTDREIALALGRSRKSVTNRRVKLGLKTNRSKARASKKFKGAYATGLDDTEKRKFYEQEVRNSSTFKNVQESLS